MSDRYLGIILPKSTYEAMPGLEGGTRSMFLIWERAARERGLMLCYFRFFDVKPGQEIVSAYVYEEKTFHLKEVPAPKVIYSRVLDHLPVFRTHIKALMKEGTQIYNVPNYDVEKHKVHNILLEYASVSPHLPHTELFSIANLNQMAARYKQLILKKSYGEFGMGAMKMERQKRGWLLSYKTKAGELKQVDVKSKLPPVLVSRVQSQTYMIQEMIPLADYKGHPFDLRVATQKDESGEFQVSGIMCKVANGGDFLTNGAQGGKTYTFEEVAPLSHPTVPYATLVNNIHLLALETANVLDRHFPHLADLGFDIGLTKEGKPYFIECNFISDYVGGLFQDGQLLHEKWEAVFRTPIQYGHYLMYRKKD
ncbi:YheC/YheD family protein [Bacillus sp. RAR_GA_16]|uniref:YheC/YheD family protein n=1 Tax=Bacillus sp. RAR_GA_16 TaxID=2876774 RepID=UPI001CCD1F60|nr:YheC/YheD family protein [Bacillus sp. RAR_GA_16]MCA0173021.1 YheC/YheD family protein [Bacillus sp. RAR_GA_16]